MDSETWRLQRLVNSFEQVEQWDISKVEAIALLEKAYEIEAWLGAERHYNLMVSQWLSAEKRWHLTKDLLANNPVYRAAEAGWLKMREICNNLDGVDDFSKLTPILQDRYALFAAEAYNVGYLRGFRDYDDWETEEEFFEASAEDEATYGI